ncbi:hypothetical protein BHE74_00031201 [Ensete ventricosum]|nr:hypothetical protein BHE74_00031201 [Ensete ventricosum]
MLVRWTVNWGRMLRSLKCLTCYRYTDRPLPEYLARAPSSLACRCRPRVACAPSLPAGRPRGEKDRGDVSPLCEVNCGVAVPLMCLLVFRAFEHIALVHYREVIEQRYSSEADYYVANHSRTKLGTDEAPISAENSAFASYLSDIWYDQSQFEVPFGTESSLTVPQGHLFTIREVSPEWAFSSENTKVLMKSIP